MKIVVMDKRSGRYLKSLHREYTAEFDEAVDFLTEQQARDFCRSKDFTGHKIVARSHRLGVELHLADF